MFCDDSRVDLIDLISTCQTIQCGFWLDVSVDFGDDLYVDLRRDVSA